MPLANIQREHQLHHPPSMQHFNSTSTQFDNINFNQDVAIRQFCPARIDQEYSEWNDELFDLEAWSSSFDSSSPPCSLSIDEDEDSMFIDSIINNTSLCKEVVDTSDEVGSSFSEDSSIHKGLELVNLLLACAEAVGCRDTALASSTLGQIWPLVNPNGDSLRRVSFYFAIGLKSRLSLLQNVGINGSLNAAAANIKEKCTFGTKEEKMDAFNYLYQTTPYVAFGFLAANNAICQAAKGKDHLHIVDLGMSRVLQWPSFIQMLASRPDGPPPRVRITGISPPDSNISELESNMKFLIHEASMVGVQVEFRVVTESSSPSLLTSENLDIRQGETLFVNSTMHLHRYVKDSRGSLKAVLVAIRKLNPTLLTVAEQDANHNGPFFIARFLESLHYYSAVFDSLEGSLPRPSLERMKIERSHFGEEIHNIVSCEGGERVERHERADQWRRQLGRAGFQGVGIELTGDTKMLASAYGCEGYTVGSEKGCLLLGWKGRPIMWASAWQVNGSSSSS